MLKLGSIAAVLAIAALALPAHAAPPAPSDARHALAAVMKPPGRAMPADVAQLDAMLARGDNAALTQRLRSVTTAREGALDMNWEAARLYDGAGILLAMAYANDLWRQASVAPATAAAGGDTAEALKQSSVAYGLYSLELILLDGAKCADQTAPVHRRDQLLSLYQPIWVYALTLPPADRANIVRVALTVEAATAPVRREDAVLCSGGMVEIEQGLAAGQTPQPVPGAPGVVGKTYAIPEPPGYKPKFLPAATWRPIQDERRAHMPDILTRLMTPPAAAH